MLYQRRNPRRGVLLLVVMALLALMATVTMTFVLVSGIQMRSARSTALADLESDSHEQLLDAAMDQILRGPENFTSPIGAHSLLEDVYGLDGRLTGAGGDEIYGPLKGTLDADATYFTDPDTMQEFQDIVVLSFTLDVAPPEAADLGFYDGRLITMLDGSGRGVTRRILRYVEPDGTTNGNKLHVKSFGGDLPDDGDRFLINDRPFTGTGFGLGYQTPQTNALDHKFEGTRFPGGWERALLPNHSTIAIKFGDLGTGDHPDVAGVGGADEDYDAPDYQNEFMAMMIADKATGTHVVKPSFYDPAVINYWNNRIATDPVLVSASTMNPEYIRDLKRKMSFRPFSEDHPDFPRLDDPVDGPWDVDNDGNGREDSTWIDLGMTVQTDSSGRQYKPLFAILCVDLDGRINLNAHGSPMHLVRNSVNWPRGRFVGPFADKSGEALVPIGQGYGPADVMLNHLFETGASARAYQPDDLYHLMHGREIGGISVAGRYGEPSLLPGYNNGETNVPMPGLTTLWDTTTYATNWGIDGEDDDLDGTAGNITEKLLSQHDLTDGIRDDNFPPSPVAQVDVVNSMSTINDLRDFRGNASAAGPLADLNSDGAVVPDLRGEPIYISHGDGADAIDDPYEIDLTRTNSQQRRESVDGSGKLAEVDAPFKPSDLEVLLRMKDADVGTLYSRLLELAGDTFLNSTNAEFNRSIVTTESWDSPTVASMLGLPEEPGSPFNWRAEQLLVSRLGASANNEHLRKGLAPELLDGLKLDLNRPFGNSVDDDETSTDPGYGVIDEPGDGSPADGNAAEFLWEDPAIGGVLFDHDNNGQVDVANRDARIKEANLARQAFARHLYILAMALRNKNAPIDHASPADQLVTAREIAQWCINVVDFRDSDSIMTAFEYDPHPFDADGWSVDGDITTDDLGGRNVVVWGVERPELLITETIAGHDRGTDDTTEDDLTSDPEATDPNDYDQVARPDGWVAIELFNPQSEATSKPAELYDNDGLELSATAGSSPVWRLVFGTPDDTNHAMFDDTDTDPLDLSGDPRHDPVLEPTAIQRTVYFTTAGPMLGDASVEYYRSGGKVCIPPGRYAVVASVGVEADGTETNDLTIGRHTTGVVDRPVLDLDVAGTPAVGIPHLFHADNEGMVDEYPKYDGQPGGPPVPATDEIIRAPISIIIDSPYELGVDSRRMSISEPVDGYAGKDPAGFMIPGGVAEDDPWDQTDPTTPWVAVAGTDSFATSNIGGYSRVYLQRLANPMLATGHDPDTNPYLTVDSMPLDLWIYNSSANDIAGTGAEPDSIRSRERLGDAATADDTDDNRNIWRQWAGDETPGSGNAPTPDTTTHASLKLQHTLGYLNSVWHEGAAADHRWWTPKRFQADNPDALAGGVYAFAGVDQDFYTGAPLTPAPWLAWNNRPYMSKYELMMVPKSSPAELLAEFSVRENTSFDPYGNANPESEFSGTYGTITVSHLLNFFHTSDEAGVTTNANDLYRIFEFVDVPSRFSGLEEMLDPQAFNSQTGPSTDPVFGWDTAGMLKMRSFAPPFNYQSRFREPGKININTIFEYIPVGGAGESAVWTALLGGYDFYVDAEVEAQWWKVIDSRRGYGDTSFAGRMDKPNANYPTFIARPFRSFSGGTFVPLASLKHSGIDSTLLRSSPDILDASTSTGQPLLGVNLTAPNTNTNKNPMFRYQLMNRLSNMVTTRSNVYAVWITVGYFEVEPVDRNQYLANGYTDEELDRVFPDGYRLKGELGADTGEVERHRAFYMVDRLVPVAFERGKTHNTRKTIRLRTMID